MKKSEFKKRMDWFFGMVMQDSFNQLSILKLVVSTLY